MQRPGTEAIRTPIQPSKPKREINKITNSQNTKRTYGQPSDQLFPKMWPLSNPNRTKNNMNTRKVKRHRNPDTKIRQQRTTTQLSPWNDSSIFIIRIYNYFGQAFNNFRLYDNSTCIYRPTACKELWAKTTSVPKPFLLNESSFLLFI